MANFTFNIAKGRVAEFYERVDTNDPAGCGLRLVVLSANDSELNGQDYDNLDVLLTGTDSWNEAATAASAWGARKTLVGSDLTALAPDDTNNRMDTEIPQIDYSTVAASNNSVGILVCYVPATATSADSDIIPLTHHDFAVTTDGNDVRINTGDFLRAS